jgi:heat shock protein HslJ
MKRVIYIFAIAFAALSCGSTKEVEPLAILTGSTWQLSTINGTSVDASAYRTLPFINFTTDNKVMGNGGCNSFSGSYNLNDEGGINLSQLVSTKMACEGVNEAEFITTLEKANMTKIDPDKLTLLTGVDEVLVFVPKNTR